MKNKIKQDYKNGKEPKENPEIRKLEYEVLDLIHKYRNKY